MTAAAAGAYPAYEAPFWTSGRDGVLVAQHCGHCSLYQHPPTELCCRCHRADALRFVPTSGAGKVFSFTVNWHAWREDQPTPYVIALVELNEQPGLRMLANIVDCDPAAVHVDMPVRAVFQQRGDVWMPQFMTAGSPTAAPTLVNLPGN